MEHGRREPAREPAAHREKKRRRSGGSVVGKIFGVLGTLVLIGVCTAAMFAVIFMKYVDTNVKPNVSVRAEDYTMQMSSIIYYQDKETGEWVEYQTIHGEQNRILADFDQMPDALWQAAVAVEDKRFFEHEGVDWRRTGGAVLNMFIGMKNTFGGSTITQQLLKNMTEDNDGTVNRKVREIFRALEFEKNYTKDQILELYLNTIAFGKGCYGVQTAAEYYFGKDVSELSVAECACLIAITNNPSMYGPMSTVVFTREDGTKVTARENNKERQEMILDLMADPEVGLCYLTQEEADAAKAEVLHFTDGSTSADDIVNEATGGIQINSWFVDQVILDVSNDLAEELNISVKEARLKLYNSGYNIYTTLDPDIQEIAESVYEDRSNLDVTSRSGQQLQSGITIIDPYTGNIVAMVGKVGEKTENLGWNYATGRRQVGSSVKPLTVYAPALENNVITMASTFDNYPVRLLNDNPWPKNSPQGYSGWTTLSTGVAKSINTVAVQVVEKLGLPESFAFATEKLGLGLVAEDMNTSSLGLGGLTYGLNTEEMAAAYACFANGGTYNEPRTYVKVLANDNKTVILENTGESHVAMKETTAYFMNTLLQGVVNSGTGGSAKFSGSIAIAGKTGTTSENYDRYFVGYTPYYVAAVWTGYDQNEKISYSGNPAITMWKKVMSQIHEGLEAKSFSKPSSGLERVEVCSDSGLLPTDACRADIRGESHVRTVEVAAGTAPRESCTLHKMVDYCVDGHCLATENCPAESVKQVGALDYVREDYGEKITADDDPYLIVNLEKSLEPQEPTPENPAGSPGGCPVHTTAPEVPEDPDQDPTQDPSDPNYQPPAEGGHPSGGEQSGEGPSEPMLPAEPTEPAEPETDNGGDWFSGLWTN